MLNEEIICVKNHIFTFNSSKMIFEVKEGDKFLYEIEDGNFSLVRDNYNYAVWYPISNNIFKQVFVTFSEWRDNKIDNIIKE